ncbi:hypothetical protein OGAPHI_004200 [Ogataea philodendri]|uniref:Uncharacterized protein n=1 Tax=Ogataea philodendri TaxID=1378263 RepID=A0A9P8P6N3_9ASCO|nr:uncharacterized protein OGAPHI_004200 [Ogataea philodendri]KAH3666011.1 hypothetical protein OGAPHI_004200 [Ogataea philodendri]
MDAVAFGGGRLELFELSGQRRLGGSLDAGSTIRSVLDAFRQLRVHQVSSLFGIGVGQDIPSGDRLGLHRNVALGAHELTWSHVHFVAQRPRKVSGRIAAPISLDGFNSTLRGLGRFNADIQVVLRRSVSQQSNSFFDRSGDQPNLFHLLHRQHLAWCKVESAGIVEPLDSD